MPRGACGGSGLHGGGGGEGPGSGLPSADLQGTLAPVGPLLPGVAKMALLCSCSTQRKRVGVLTAAASPGLCPLLGLSQRPSVSKSYRVSTSCAAVL